MNAHKETHDEYEFTVWGRGVSCALAFDGRSVHWQGDDAEEIVRRVDRDGPAVLPCIWDEYEHLSEEDC